MPGLDLEATRELRDAIGWLFRTLVGLASTMAQCSLTSRRPARALAAENLFLRKQLALFQELEAKRRRVDCATRIALVWLMKAFNWREALVIVKPATLIRWHREGFRLFWKLKSRSWPTRVATRVTGLDPSDGAGEPDLGRGADC